MANHHFDNLSFEFLTGIMIRKLTDKKRSTRPFILLTLSHIEKGFEGPHKMDFVLESVLGKIFLRLSALAIRQLFKYFLFSLFGLSWGPVGIIVSFLDTFSTGLYMNPAQFKELYGDCFPDPNENPREYRRFINKTDRACQLFAIMTERGLNLLQQNGVLVPDRNKVREVMDYLTEGMGPDQLKRASKALLNEQIRVASRSLSIPIEGSKPSLQGTSY